MTEFYGQVKGVTTVHRKSVVKFAVVTTDLDQADFLAALEGESVKFVLTQVQQPLEGQQELGGK